MTINRRLPDVPTVAIVGRANVGKSTLWNRLAETSQALISKQPNTTRDRNYATCLWRGATVRLTDTGGMDAELETQIGKGIVHQAELAIREADLVLFLLDVDTGVMPQDKELAKKVRKINPQIILVANKSDLASRSGSAQSKEAWKLGLGEPVAISAANGRGVGDLLDMAYDKLEELKRPPVPFEDKERLRIVIMGRPNVGKSSLMNAIVGQERSIVSPIAHTTREPLDTDFEWNGRDVKLVDTAGMRKRAHITERLEKEAVERNRQALGRADVAVLVLDATEDPRKQDKTLAGLLMNAKKGLIIVVNKWDLIADKKTGTADDYAAAVRHSLPFLAWAPILFTSAASGQRAYDILELAFRIKIERERLIEKNALDKFLKHMIAKQPPRAASGTRAPYIAHVVQTGSNPPTFLMTLRGTKVSLHNAWIRFFENQLRAKFGFTGTPMTFDMEYDASPEIKTFKGPHRRKRPIGRKGGRY